MNASQFYLTLPSNSNRENTASIFQTALPQQINLEGNWECALVEVIYANSWFNVAEENNVIKFFDIDRAVRHLVKLPRGRYEDIDDLVTTLNASIEVVAQAEKVPYGDYLSFKYSAFKKTVQLKINTAKIRTLKMPENVAYMMGFKDLDIAKIDYSKKEVLISNAHYPPDMQCGLSYLYIYCDILEPQIIGTTLAPLLQVVNVEGKYTDLVSRIYPAPHYVPVLKKCFNTIEIVVKNDQDRPVNFTFGKTIIKMHFRKIRSTFLQ